MLSIKKFRIAVISFLFILSLVPFQPARADLLSFSGGISATGTEPFDSLDPGADNLLVRTHDYVSYRFTYVTSSTGLGANAKITLTLADGTPPTGYTGDPLGHTMTWFQIPAPCLDPVYPPEVPAAGQSGIIDDGQTLICDLNDVTTAQQQTIDFRARVLGHVPNGTILPPPTAEISADGVSPIPATEETGGGLMGLPDLTAAAAPRWDVTVSTSTMVMRYVPGSGPSGENGVLINYLLGARLNGSRIGAEALDGNLDITMDVSQLPPGARILTWEAISGKINEPTACKSLNASDYPYENAHNNIRDVGPSSSTHPATVANGGSCAATQPGGAGSTVYINISGFDSSLVHYPIYLHNTFVPVINPFNLNDSSNQWHIISKTLYLWIPIESYPIGEFSWPVYINSEAYSITGQENVDVGNETPPVGNNTRRDPFINLPRGNFRKIFSILSNDGGIHALRDPNLYGDAYVTSAEPTQKFTSRVHLVNSGAQTLTDVEICEKIDNSRLTVFDIREDPGSFGIWNMENGVSARMQDLSTDTWLPTPSELYTVEWGIGPQWTSFSATWDKYSEPEKTGSHHADGLCSDSGITWYADVDTVPDMQNVTHIRITVPNFDPNLRLFFYIGLQARSTFYYDVTDILPDSTTETFTAGDSTIGTHAYNQVHVNFTSLSTVPHDSDVVEINTTTFAQISKQAVGRPDNALVIGGEIITYELQPNLTSPGEIAFPTDVEVKDVLPPTLTFIPGTVTIGGSPAADPILQPDTPAPGYTTLTFNLPNQIPGLGSAGVPSGDLDPIRFQARVSLLGQDGDNILNSTTITSEHSGYSICQYDLGGDTADPQDDTGYVRTPDSIVPCMYSNWTLEIDSPPGFRIVKSSEDSNVELDEAFSYELRYSAIGTQLNDLRILDILPNVNDGRTPPSDFTGTLSLTGVTLPANDPAAALRFTRNDPANINGDPYHASNLVIDGSGANSAARTVWCTQAQFGVGNCPAALDQVTAFLILTDPSLTPDVEYAATITLQPDGNFIGDRYTNRYNAGSPDFTEFLVSNDVPVNVVAGSLSGFVYLDNNNNGVFDDLDGETGIPGVAVTLTCTAGPSCTPGTVYTTLTDASGAYQFAAGDTDIFPGETASGEPLAQFPGLNSGTWQVSEAQPEGYIDGLDTAGNLGGTVSNDLITQIVMPVGGRGQEYNFGERLNAAIGDRSRLVVEAIPYSGE